MLKHGYVIISDIDLTLFERYDGRLMDVKMLTEWATYIKNTYVLFCV